MKKTFFSRDKNFYAALFPLLIIISLQNLISYSVNMADNIMLGAYSQNALSGAALVNQVFFLIQQANSFKDCILSGNLFDSFMFTVFRRNFRIFYV